MLANRVDARLGSVTSRFEHFHEWKRLAEDETGAVDMETMLKGVCQKSRLLMFAYKYAGVCGMTSGACTLSEALLRKHQPGGLSFVERRRLFQTPTCCVEIIP